MNELDGFRKWAADIGHYNIVEAVDRYRKMLETCNLKSWVQYKELKETSHES